MSEGREPIRSYQRIFRPERRIYQIEGRTLPVPGGIPLRWLAYATATLLVVLALGSGSAAVAMAAAALAAVAGFCVGGRTAAAVSALGAFAASYLCGWVLGLLDWPLRLVVLPAAVATLATQATPDGRRADRFALSWLAIRLAPQRRSLGRALPTAGRPHLLGGELWVAPDERAPRLRRARVRGSLGARSLWVAPDERAPRLRRARVRGPALIFFSAAVELRRSGLRKRRLRARPKDGEARERLALGAREVLEVRP